MVETIPLITLNEAYSDYETKGGLFGNIGNLPWNSIMVGAQMDTLYFDTHSGERFGSRIITRRVGADGSLATADRNAISTLVYAMFRNQWGRLWATMNPDYEPLTNYQMTEDEAGNHTDTRTPDLTRKHVGTDKDEGSTTLNTQNNLWGFNSESSIPSDMQDGTNTANNTNTRDLTDTETGTDTTIGQNTRTRTRKGNIGTNTFQNLLQQERNLWMYNFFEQIFKDVDSVLTIPIY